MNEYEQSLYDTVIMDKLDSISRLPEYQKLSKEQSELQEKLEDQITGAQKRLYRRCTELSNQIASLEVELVFRETLALARALYLGQAAR